MAKYLVKTETTCTTSDWYEADSEDEAIEQAKIDFENMDDFGEIADVDFEILEKQDE